MIQLPILCQACAWLEREPSSDGSPEFYPERCQAYPKGIPEDILAGGDHREPRGDEAGGRIFSELPEPLAAVQLAGWERYRAAVLAEARDRVTSP